MSVYVKSVLMMLFLALFVLSIYCWGWSNGRKQGFLDAEPLIVEAAQLGEEWSKMEHRPPIYYPEQNKMLPGR